MNRTSKIVVLAFAMTILVACVPVTAPTPVPAEADQQESIEGIIWQWIVLNNQATGVTQEVSTPENYTIVFNPDGTTYGAAECNNFSGVYSQEDGFTITLGPTTLAFCGDASLDQQYLELLGAVAAGGLDGTGGLALETAGGEQRMEFQNGGQATQP